MASINSKDVLVDALAASPDIDSKAAAERVLNVFIDTMKSQVASGVGFGLHGLLSLEVKDVPAREVRNVRTGEKIAKAAGRAVKAKVGASLKKLVS